jgi:glycosyltransferase involved in cell wall biosynthesis
VRSVPTIRTIHNVTLWPSWRAVGQWTERRLGGRPAIGVSAAALTGLDAFRASAGLAPLPDDARRLVLNGVASPPLRDRPDRPADGVRVLFAGRLEHQKGADLIPAIWDACGNAPDTATLTVIGDGSLEPELRVWADTAGAAVRLLPPVYGIAGMLKDFDVLLMPSRFEGLPLLAVEALMAGVPVVAFDSPGLREVFPAGYPLLAPTQNVEAIAALLARRIAAPVLPDRERTIAFVQERFGLHRMAQEYAGLYDRMVARADITVA